jgi:hypothetical protein
VEPITIATSAVALLAPYLNKAGGKAAEEIGKEAGGRIVKLYDAVKSQLSGEYAAEALADLETEPQNEDAKASLRQQLRKQLERDDDLKRILEELLEDIEKTTGQSISQVAKTIGDHNVTMQISGPGNVVR